MSSLVAVSRPEAGAVRCEHLVAKYDVAVFIQTKFKLGIRNDDATG